MRFEKDTKKSVQETGSCTLPVYRNVITFILKDALTWCILTTFLTLFEFTTFLTLFEEGVMRKRNHDLY